MPRSLLHESASAQPERCPSALISGSTKYTGYRQTSEREGVQAMAALMAAVTSASACSPCKASGASRHSPFDSEASRSRACSRYMLARNEQACAMSLLSRCTAAALAPKGYVKHACRRFCTRTDVCARERVRAWTCVHVCAGGWMCRQERGGAAGRMRTVPG